MNLSKIGKFESKITSFHFNFLYSISFVCVFITWNIRILSNSQIPYTYYPLLSSNLLLLLVLFFLYLLPKIYPLQKHAISLYVTLFNFFLTLNNLLAYFKSSSINQYIYFRNVQLGDGYNGELKLPTNFYQRLESLTNLNLVSVTLFFSLTPFIFFIIKSKFRIQHKLLVFFVVIYSWFVGILHSNTGSPYSWLPHLEKKSNLNHWWIADRLNNSNLFVNADSPLYAKFELFFAASDKFEIGVILRRSLVPFLSALVTPAFNSGLFYIALNFFSWSFAIIITFIYLHRNYSLRIATIGMLLLVNSFWLVAFVFQTTPHFLGYILTVPITLFVLQSSNKIDALREKGLNMILTHIVYSILLFSLFTLVYDSYPFLLGISIYYFLALKNIYLKFTYFIIPFVAIFVNLFILKLIQIDTGQVAWENSDGFVSAGIKSIFGSVDISVNFLLFINSNLFNYLHYLIMAFTLPVLLILILLSYFSNSSKLIVFVISQFFSYFLAFLVLSNAGFAFSRFYYFVFFPLILVSLDGLNKVFQINIKWAYFFSFSLLLLTFLTTNLDLFGKYAIGYYIYYGVVAPFFQ